MVNDLDSASTSNEKVIQLLEEQITFMKQQNGDLSKQNKDLLNRIEVLTEQIHQLTKALYSSKSEKSKYQASDGQGSLVEDDLSFSESEQTEESTETISYTVIRKKKRNDPFRNDIGLHMQNSQLSEKNIR